MIAGLIIGTKMVIEKFKSSAQQEESIEDTESYDHLSDEELRERAREAKEKGKHSTALDMYQILLIRAYQTDNPENQKYIVSYYVNVANLYEQLHNYHKSLENYHHALDLLNSVVGENHPSTAIVKSDMGRIYSKLGEHKNGLKFCTEALQLMKTQMGENHPEVLVTMNDIADIQFRLKNFKEAGEMFEFLIASYIKTGGETQRSVAVVLNKLGAVYLEAEQFEKAVETFEKGIAILKTVNKDEIHPELAILAEDLAGAYEHQGDKEKAIKWYEEALRINNQFADERPLPKVNSLNKLGRTYSRLGDMDKAISFMREAADFCEARFGPKSAQGALEHLLLGMLYERKENYELAQKEFEICLEFEMLEKNGMTLSGAESMSHKGRIMALRGNVDEGLKLCSTALNIAKDHLFEEKSTECAKIYFDIGKCYVLKGDKSEAKPHLEKAYEIMKNIFGQHELFVGYIAKDLAEVCDSLGNNDRAKEYLKEALTIYKWYLGKNHKSVVESVALAKKWGVTVDPYFLQLQIQADSCIFIFPKEAIVLDLQMTLFRINTNKICESANPSYQI